MLKSQDKNGYCPVHSYQNRSGFWQAIFFQGYNWERAIPYWRYLNL